MLGRFEDRRSLVLTEDDHFAWYTAWLQRRHEVPAGVRRALSSKGLLFLGFQLGDWDFRVIFHAIKSFGAGDTMLRENQHVGVQISPENEVVEQEAAQEYRESYFGIDQVNIFWGATWEFLKQLRDKTGLLT